MVRNLPKKEEVSFAGITFRGYSYQEGVHVPIVELQQIVRVKGITFSTHNDNMSQSDVVDIVDQNRRNKAMATAMYYPENDSIVYTVPRTRTWIEIFQPSKGIAIPMQEKKRGRISLPG